MTISWHVLRRIASGARRSGRTSVDRGIDGGINRGIGAGVMFPGLTMPVQMKPSRAASCDRIHHSRADEGQPGLDAVEDAAYRAACHIDGRIATFIDAACLGVLPHADYRTEGGVRRLSYKTRGACGYADDCEQHDDVQTSTDHQYRNHRPQQCLDDRIGDDQWFSLMPVDDCTSQQRASLLQGRGQCGQPPGCGERMGDGECDQRNGETP